MYFKILKKDIKRKKTMNIILLIFIILATAFIASSVHNLTLTMLGTANFLEIADVQDYIIVSMNAENEGETEDDHISLYLNQNPYVQDYTRDEIQYFGASNFILPNGDVSKESASILITCFNIKQQKFYDENNNLINNMEDGTVFLPLSFLETNSLKKGDTIQLKTKSGYEKSFKIAGIHKDAFLGSAMMGTHRFLFSEKDFAEIMSSSDMIKGSIFSINTTDLEAFKKDLNQQDIHVIFRGDKAFISMSYILDMVIAAVLIMVSIFLIIIAIVMLRFIIVFSVNEDYREIGIMKAIGLKNNNIRIMYAVKYFVLAVIGAALGFGISIPFGNMMLEQILKNMVMQTDQGLFVIQILLSVLVACFITGFAYFSTRRIKSLSPMDAIRCGNNGERFKKKGVLKLAKSKLKSTTFLAVNDVLSEKKKFVTLFFVGMIGIWLVSMPAITINTLRSEKIAAWFAVLNCDIYIQSNEELSECINQHDIQGFYNYLDKVKNTLEEDDIPVEKIFLEVMFRFRIEHEDKSYLSLSIQGVGTSADEYRYEEGTAPKYENEIALAALTAKEIDAGLGDKVTINMYGEKREFIVTALYQSMNNMGEGIRFSEKTDVDYNFVAGCFPVQVCIKGEAKGKQLQTYIDKVTELFPNAEVMNTTEFISSLTGDVAGQLVSLKIIILSVVTAIIILVVVLMQKMFLLKERGEMGLLKSMGFSDADIIKWQTKRIALVLFLSIIAGLITILPFSKLTSGQVFKIMGASTIEFVINPLEIYVIYPIVILAATLAICIFTMFSVKKIKLADLNNIE